MRERVPCEFSLVRYVPDVVKGEFVNIGVLLREAAGPAPSPRPGTRSAASRSKTAGTASSPVQPEAQVRFTRDWSRVRCMDATADVGLLEDLEQEFAQRLRAGATAHEPRELLEIIEDSLSNSIQMSSPRASLAENLTAEMEQLMRLYVEPMQIQKAADKPARKLTGRASIQTSIRNEFEHSGVWAMMNKRIAVERYTSKGDPLRLDCGYRKLAANLPAQPPGSTIRMFQAISLDSDIELAKSFAFTAERLREGVTRVEGATLELTAVVEPLLLVTEEEEGEAFDRYKFGLTTMEQQAIRVITLNDLARAAATARLELGL